MGSFEAHEQPSETMTEFMGTFVKDFASSHRPAVAVVRTGRAAAIFGLVSLIIAASGCAWLGTGGSQPAKVEPSDDAYEIARAGMARQPSEPYWPYRLAELSAASDSTAAAVGHLQVALATDADYAPALSLLTRLYYEAGAHAEAIALLEAHLSRHPQACTELKVALALHLDAIGERERAASVIGQCTGDSRELRTARAYLSLRGDDPGRVLDLARQALDADRDSAVNHNNYGLALLCAGRPLEARDAFHEAIERDSALAGALYNMAIVETFYLFNDTAGREWFARYRRHSSDDPDGLASVLQADVSKLTPPGSR
jgi:tetratricopeptide (TPR) repeat protein